MLALRAGLSTSEVESTLKRRCSKSGPLYYNKLNQCRFYGNIIRLGGPLIIHSFLINRDKSLMAPVRVPSPPKFLARMEARAEARKNRIKLREEARRKKLEDERRKEEAARRAEEQERKRLQQEVR